MEIVLVRHAEPEWVKDGLNVDNPPLTDRGHEQARLLAPRLQAETFDEIYVSPLVRAGQTLAPSGLTAQTAHWLEEIRNPVWHGTPAEKAEAAYREDRARPSEDRWLGLPGGEPVSEFVARIRENSGLFLAERGVEAAGSSLPVWKIAEPGRRLLFVAHAGTNAVIICHLLGLEPVPWEWDRFVINHGSISRLEAMPTGDGFSFGLTRLSDTEHLPLDLRTR